MGDGPQVQPVQGHGSAYGSRALLGHFHTLEPRQQFAGNSLEFFGVQGCSRICDGDRQRRRLTAVRAVHGDAQPKLDVRKTHELASALLHREYGHGGFGLHTKPVHVVKNEVQAWQQYELSQHAVDLGR